MNENAIDRIVRLINEKGLKDKDIYEPIGITQSTFSTWKKRGTAPLKYLGNIAFALGVSRHYLETGIFDEEEEYKDLLNSKPELKVLVDAAKDLSEEQIKKIVGMIETFK